MPCLAPFYYELIAAEPPSPALKAAIMRVCREMSGRRSHLPYPGVGGARSSPVTGLLTGRSSKRRGPFLTLYHASGKPLSQIGLELLCLSTEPLLLRW
jgi:hypothetical protein